MYTTISQLSQLTVAMRQNNKEATPSFITSTTVSTPINKSAEVSLKGVL